MRSGAPGAASEAVVDVAGVPRSAATIQLPSAIPAFLEACGKLAEEAAERGELARARALIE